MEYSGLCGIVWAVCYKVGYVEYLGYKEKCWFLEECGLCGIE